MKAFYAKGGAGIEAMALRDMPGPGDPGAGEALVRLTAATLNFRDLIMLKGLLPGLTKEPEYIPLSCAAGEVLAVGEGVTRVKPGDRVNPLFAQGWLEGPPDPSAMLGGSADGVARQSALFDAESLCVLPDMLGDLEAASLPCAGVTAWSALFAPRPLRPGEWVLLQGTGGVSIAALQWAKAAGANVAITSSSAAKRARAEALGADITADYRRQDWAEELRASLAERGADGVDIVIDVLGRSALDPYAGLLREGGIIAAVGMLEDGFSWSEKEAQGKPIHPISVGDRRAHEALLSFIADRGVRPVVDIVYDLERLPDALRHLESQRFFGKIGVNLL